MCPSRFSRTSARVSVAAQSEGVTKVNYWLIVNGGGLPADGRAGAEASVGIMPAAHDVCVPELSLPNVNACGSFLKVDNDPFM
jgi:hypothetical protein